MHYIFKNIITTLITLVFLNDSLIIAQLSIAKKDTIVISKSTISTKDNEYAPFAYKGFLYFTSDKPLKVGKLTWNEDFGIPTNVFKAKIKDSVKFTNITSIDKINTALNEGPICFSKSGAYYSATKNVSNKFTSKQLPSRIYYIKSLEDSSNSKPIEIDIPLNDSITISHPAIYNDTVLFYTYYKLGSPYGTDLYFSTLQNNHWSSPMRCKEYINTNDNECFPTIHNGYLYFSSNRPDGIGMLDIYRVELDKLNSEVKPVQLLNSQKDDFSPNFINENEGYFSSNRKGSDDIFQFKKTELPKFENCTEQQFNSYSYNFKELADYETHDTTDMYYEWDFGDGEKAKGLMVDHSFAGEGKYEIKLNVIQKSNNEFFDNQLSYELEVVNIKQLYISCFDTVAIKDTVVFDSEYTNLENFIIEKYYWQIETKEKYYYEGSTLRHMFDKPGSYTIKLMVAGKENELKKTYCTYRKIIVKEMKPSTNTKRIPLINKNR